MIKSEETEVDRHPRSLAPARPLASEVCETGEPEKRRSLVSSFRRLAYCATESAGSGPAALRRSPMRRAEEAVSG